MTKIDETIKHIKYKFNKIDRLFMAVISFLILTGVISQLFLMNMFGNYTLAKTALFSALSVNIAVIYLQKSYFDFRLKKLAKTDLPFITKIVQFNNLFSFRVMILLPLNIYNLLLYIWTGRLEFIATYICVTLLFLIYRPTRKYFIRVLKIEGVAKDMIEKSYD